MNIIVADSCALILLAKSGLLKTLTEFRRVIVPAAVFEEVVRVNRDRAPISPIITSRGFPRR